MKRLTPTILASILTIAVSSTALAGNIPVGRMAGHIPLGRAAGNIPVGRASSSVNNPAVFPTTTARFDLESAFAGLIRMLFDGAALL
jgi:hypothetical protein